ncbi:unnamed protein product [Soboliphyme baturini]|uniref:PET domain-containing protein n=1 Tax=Soboliphyme baturini TaxID=241478 RepID=A0A183IEQ9_9BILA|nr:unnamed protein product [Soboliphyme baturini]
MGIIRLAQIPGTCKASLLQAHSHNSSTCYMECDSSLKSCSRCKCPREAHDIHHHKAVSVEDRLGWRSTNLMQTSKDNSTDAGYSWMPPGLTKQKVEEYMSQLPNHKVPRINTPGEKYRDRQLILQLPKQDLSSSYSKHLYTLLEKRAFEDFINKRNESALDIAYIRANSDKPSVSNDGVHLSSF